MALTKPILYNIDAFDATKPQVFTFESIGGDQVVANQLTIINQSTGNIVYQNRKNTNAFIHNLPAETLTNGLYYSAYIVTYNDGDEVSSQSTAIQFRCYSTPTWHFINIPEDGIINNAVYVFEIEYDQTEREKLSSYEVYFYDAERNLVDYKSIIVSYGALTPARRIENYEVKGLNNNTIYYIQTKCKTQHGMRVDTGLIEIRAFYTMPTVYTALSLVNECEKGYIDVTGNILTIEGHSSPSVLPYVENDTAASLNLGDYIIWDENLSIQGNYKAILWGRSFSTSYPPVLSRFTFSIEDDSKEEIAVVIDDVERSRTYRLHGYIYGEDGDLKEQIYSDTISIANMALLQQIIVIKNNGEYTLEYKLLQEYSNNAVLGKAIIGMMILGTDEV